MKIIFYNHENLLKKRGGKTMRSQKIQMKNRIMSLKLILKQVYDEFDVWRIRKIEIRLLIMSELSTFCSHVEVENRDQSSLN